MKPAPQLDFLAPGPTAFHGVTQFATPDTGGFPEHGGFSAQSGHSVGARADVPVGETPQPHKAPTAQFPPMLLVDPAAPFVANSPTSKAAAASVDAGGAQSARKLQQNEALAWFFTRSDYGGTCDELEVGTGMSHQSASARCVDLVKAGFLVRSDMTRKTRSGRSASVLVATATP